MKNVITHIRQRLLIALILPLADLLMQTKISYYYKLLKKLQLLGENEIQHWQRQQLKKLILHSYYNTTYYNNLFKKENLSPSDIQSIDDLKKLPPLTKEIVRDNFQDFIPRNINKMQYRISSTGGSSGDPFVYYLDSNSWSITTANNILNWEKVGYKYGEKFVALGSTSLFVKKNHSIKHRIYYKLKNKVGFNGVNMSADMCEKYIHFIKRKKIKYIYGYASAIYLLARYALEQKESCNIKVCFTTSEILSIQYRKTIREAFRCKIVDCYGAHDGGISAYAFSEGFFEVGYNSIVGIENSQIEGMGPALITDLFNFSMPLINYKVGDEIQMNNHCSKDYSYNGQLIKKVAGRSSDLLYLDNGRILTGPGFTILFKDIPIEYYCLEKTAKNALVCWIIKLPEFNLSNEKTIFQTIRKNAGENISIKIKYTDKPFLSKSGKRQYMIDNSKI